MERSQNSISWQQWLSDTSIGDEARGNRKLVLRHWAKANGKEGPNEVLEDIFLDRVNPYITARNFIDSLREMQMKPSTVNLYRSMLPDFFESVLGEQNFSRKTFDRLCPRGENFVSVTKKAPTVEELKHLLRIANPRDRALLSILCSGMRIGEALSRKMSEIEDRGKYYRIKLIAQATKTRRKRYVFLTKECVDLIKDYHAGLASEWIFPGIETTVHLSDVTGWDTLKDLFKQGGLNDTEDEIYSPHSMRTFTQSQMRKCGFNETWTKATIGHTIGSNQNYLDWDEIGDEWFEKCAERMTWLSERPTELLNAQKEEIRELRDKVTKMEQELRGASEEILSLPADQRALLIQIVKELEEAKTKQITQKALPDNMEGSKGEVGT